ncbi:MAG TPA: hypothetical protein VGI69_01625 [Gaiellaceae bacterium]|jgi:hypothetical protein
MKGNLIRRTLVAPAIAGVLLAAGGIEIGTAVAASSSPAATTSGGLAGKWVGHYSGAVSGHFTIHWKKTGARLYGNIALSNPKGTYGIGGSVRDGKIKFGAVSVGAKYNGKVRGTSMSGTWTSPEGGGSWSASKS